jgi:hypothetical protein
MEELMNAMMYRVWMMIHARMFTEIESRANEKKYVTQRIKARDIKKRQLIWE